MGVRSGVEWRAGRFFGGNGSGKGDFLTKWGESGSEPSGSASHAPSGRRKPKPPIHGRFSLSSQPIWRKSALPRKHFPQRTSPPNPRRRYPPHPTYPFYRNVIPAEILGLLPPITTTPSPPQSPSTMRIPGRAGKSLPVPRPREETGRGCSTVKKVSF